MSSIDLHIFRRANAGVVSQSIVAGARTTDTRMCNTLVNICRIENTIVNKGKEDQALASISEKQIYNKLYYYNKNDDLKASLESTA